MAKSSTSSSSSSSPPRLDENGWEILDPRPLEIPGNVRIPETLAQQVQRLVRTSISAHAAAQGLETFEESEDFDVADDFDPTSPFEVFFDPVIGKEISAAEFRQHEARYKEEALLRTRNYYRARHLEETLEEGHKRGAGVSPAPSPKPVEDGSEAS